MVSNAYTITDTKLIPSKMANTDISIWYWCILKCYGCPIFLGCTTY